MNFEEEHLDVLQNIEFAIVSVYRQEPSLVDFDVENALSALISHYQAEAKQHEARLPRLGERATEVYERVQTMCEWRLGREAMVAEKSGRHVPPPAPVTLEVIIACLKRIRKSVQHWNREGGRQGYLTFVQQYVV